MDDFAKILAQSLLASIKEIENTTDLDYLIDYADSDIREEAILIKNNINSIKAILGAI